MVYPIFYGMGCVADTFAIRIFVVCTMIVIVSGVVAPVVTPDGIGVVPVIDSVVLCVGVQVVEVVMIECVVDGVCIEDESDGIVF